MAMVAKVARITTVPAMGPTTTPIRVEIAELPAMVVPILKEVGMATKVKPIHIKGVKRAKSSPTFNQLRLACFESDSTQI